MIWLDEYIKENCNEAFHRIILRLSRRDLDKKDNAKYKSFATNMKHLNHIELAIVSIIANTPFDAGSMVSGGGLKRTLLLIHIFLIFDDLVDFNKVKTNEMLRLINYARDRYKFDFDDLGKAHCVKVTKGIINSFLDTKIPNIDYRDVLGNDIYYLDMPKKFKLDNNHEIHAMFVTKDNILMPYTSDYNIGNKKNMVMLELDNFGELSFCQMGTLFSLNNKSVVSRLLTIAKMIILYYKSTNSQGRSLRLKHGKNKTEVVKIPKQYKKLLKRSEKILKPSPESFFKIQYLKKPILDSSWRKDISTDSSWKLNKIIQVSGYWRWQPHGEKNSQRKLIYVNSYIKGKGEVDTRVKMDVIHTDIS